MTICHCCWVPIWHNASDGFVMMLSIGDDDGVGAMAFGVERDSGQTQHHHHGKKAGYILYGRR